MRPFALVFFLFFQSAVVHAQTGTAILQVGNAAVTGFSGVKLLEGKIPAGIQPADKTFIDLDGPALRVIDLGRMGGPAQGQLVAAPKPFTVTAEKIGQVFSIALDDSTPPNIYVAATSAYGLPIVVPDIDGDGRPDRSRRGAPNAAFMPGLFGSVLADGGPGSIWKIDGRTGAVSIFANVILAGAPNSGPALGALAFDSVSRQIFVSDRDTGMIHRFGLDGVDRGHFDHGVTGLSAAGLPSSPHDPRKRLNIESPNFDSGNPATWAYPAPARRVFGLAINLGRLYYGVAAGSRIWSVSLLPDGSFGTDARVEVDIPKGAQPSSEISEILFDGTGDMFVAERGAPTGAFDYKALIEPGAHRVLRFRPKGPDDPPSSGLWFPAAREYAIGFPANFRNANGGIAIGYGHDTAGNINQAVCGGTLWSTGEQLRNSSERANIQRLQKGGPVIVDGLQGNSVQLFRPKNEPPFESYFIDFDDLTDRAGLTGHLGDVVIPRICSRVEFAPALFAELLASCPVGYVRIRDRCVPPPCKPDEVYVKDKCEKPSCPSGREVTLRGECCPEGLRSNGRSCVPPRGPDLTVVKKTVFCKPINTGVACKFSIVVTNTGNAPYTGELVVGDVTLPGQIGDYGGDPGWHCSGSPLPVNAPSGSSSVTCNRPNTTLQPNQSTTLEIVVAYPDPSKGFKNCAIVGTAANNSLANSYSCVEKPPGNTGLKISKTAPKSCTLVRNDGQQSIYRCEFTVTVNNDGSVPAINVSATDTPADGAIVDVQTDGSWNCVTANNSVTCTRSGALNPGASAWFKVTLEAVSPNSISTNIRGGQSYANNCAVIGGAPPLDGTGAGIANPGANFPGVVPQSSSAPGLQDGSAVNFPGLASQACARIQLPKNPRDPICVPKFVDGCVCSGPLVGPEGNQKHLCREGECNSCVCPQPFVNGVCPPPSSDCPAGMISKQTCVCTGPVGPTGERFCRVSDCQKSCVCAGPLVDGVCPAPRLPIPPPQPACQGSDCPKPQPDLCPDGTPKTDGQCPKKVLCPDGSEKKPHELCPTDKEKTKKKTKPRRQPKSDEEDVPSSGAPGFSIQIGPGGGGGRHPRPGGGDKPSGGGLNRKPG